jgi:polyferredoxin
MMESVGLPKGLIRYDSEEGIVNESAKKINPRSVGYTIVLLLIMGLVSFLLISRTDVDASILKTPGQQYQKRENNEVSNLYNYKIINKTFEDIPAEIRMMEGSGKVQHIGQEQDLIIPAESIAEGTFFLIRNMNKIEDRNTKITLGIYNREGTLLDEVNTSFAAPIKRKKQ